jgi:hypothetical protein
MSALGGDPDRSMALLPAYLNPVAKFRFIYAITLLTTEIFVHRAFILWGQ